MLDMVGLDGYVGTHESVVGVDWLNLASGALKAAGGGGGSTDDAAKKAAEEKARALEAQKAAEASASRWKWIAVLGAVALGGGYLLLRKKRR